MNEPELLEYLFDTLRRSGIEIRPAQSSERHGGLCRLRGKLIFYLDDSLSCRAQVNLICRELGRVDLSRIFVLPAVRSRIEGSHE